MKYAYTTALLAGLAAASPVATGITKRQFFGSSSTEDDLESGDCGDIIFIFARGSTETGNMVSEHLVHPCFIADTYTRDAASVHQPVRA